MSFTIKFLYFCYYSTLDTFPYTCLCMFVLMVTSCPLLLWVFFLDFGTLPTEWYFFFGCINHSDRFNIFNSGAQMSNTNIYYVQSRSSIQWVSFTELKRSKYNQFNRTLIYQWGTYFIRQVSISCPQTVVGKKNKH